MHCDDSSPATRSRLRLLRAMRTLEQLRNVLVLESGTLCQHLSLRISQILTTRTQEQNRHNWKKQRAPSLGKSSKNTAREKRSLS